MDLAPGRLLGEQDPGCLVRMATVRVCGRRLPRVILVDWSGAGRPVRALQFVQAVIGPDVGPR